MVKLISSCGIMLILIPAIFYSGTVVNAKSGGKLSQNANPTQATLPKFDKDEICSTQGCVLAAASLLNSMDKSVDPCQNFYDFACGQWRQNNPLPNLELRKGSFEVAAEKVQLRLKYLLESDEPMSVGPSRTINMTRRFYRTCLKEGFTLFDVTDDSEKKLPKISKKFLAAFRDLLRNKTDPASMAWPGGNLTNLISALENDFIANGFWELIPFPEEKNFRSRILYLDQTTRLFALKSVLVTKSDFGDYLNTSLETFSGLLSSLLSQNENETLNETESILNSEIFRCNIEDALRIEKKLVKITVNNVTDVKNITWRVADLKKNLSFVNWDEYFNDIMPKDARRVVNDSTRVIVINPDYFVKLAELIPKLDPRTLSHYLLIVALTRISSPDEYSLLAPLESDDAVAVKMPVVDKRIRALNDGEQACIEKTIKTLPLGTSALYGDKYISKLERKEVSEMMDNIASAFRASLGDFGWMDNITRTAALDKLNNMHRVIAYRDIIRDPCTLDDHFEGLAFAAHDDLESLTTKVKRHLRRSGFKALLKPVDVDEITDDLTEVNAFYAPNFNSMVVNAAMFQSPFFTLGYPKAVNYGAIGSIIGHEFTHAFDDTGMKYDKDGNLNNWWTDTAKMVFNNKTKCIIDQYNAFSVDDVNMTLNGTKSQGENIADNGGVKGSLRVLAIKKLLAVGYNIVINNHHLACKKGRAPFHNSIFLTYAKPRGYSKFKAYLTYVAQRGPEPRLPGLNMTNAQVFFLAYASKDVHNPGRFRTNVPLSNSDQFAAAYKCPPGTPMNPRRTASTKCGFGRK